MFSINFIFHVNRVFEFVSNDKQRLKQGKTSEIFSTVAYSEGNYYFF